VHPVGATPYYIAFPYTANSNQNAFSSVYFDLEIDGELRTIRGLDLSLVGTAGINDCYRRWKGFFRPFSRRSIWVELVVDVPNKSQIDSFGGQWTDNPVGNANFWFRWGVSYTQRNTGVRNLNGLYAAEQQNFRLTSRMVTLTINGCPSHMRFPEHLYGVTNLSATSTRYNIHDPTIGVNPSGSANQADSVRAQASKAYRGVLFLGGETSSAQADRQPTSTSPQISAIAEGWGKHMPPAFADVPLPGNVAATSAANYRQDWIARINNLLNSGYGEIRQKPHESSPYGSKPNVSGAGEQGTFGNAYHHNPLYHTMKSAYPKEIPFLLKAIEVNSFRGQWYYEEDGTPFQYANYPTAWIWSSTFFNRLNDLGATTPDTGGTFTWSVPEAPQQVCANPYSNWETYDREHASVQILAVAAILTGDYFGLEFCKLWAEIYGAQLFGHTGNPSIDSWAADRASARTLQSLIPLYYATGSHAARVGIIKRYWLGYLIMQSRRNWSSSRIDRLDFVEALSTNINNLGVVTYSARGIGGNAGSLYNNISGGNENPYFTVWQLSFVTVAMYQVSKMFEDLYPNGAYLTNFQAGATINTTSLVSSDPGGNRVEISKNIALSMARDLAATVTMHCTHYMGYPGSDYDWQYITLTVTGRTGLNARTLERLAECFPVGGTLVGQSTGTTGTIVLIDNSDYGGTGGNIDGSNSPWTVAIWLKNCTGPGFSKTYTATATYINEEIICTTTGYSTNAYRNGGYSGRCIDGWWGVTAYCFDRNASSQNLPGTGTNYRKPLTRTQLEETDSFRRWDSYIVEGPRWIKLFNGYGVWQSACASICVEGVRAGYYVTGDAVNYPVSDLLTKAKQIITDSINISNAQGSLWDQRIIPYIGLMDNWKDEIIEGNVEISTQNLFVARSFIPQITLTVQYIPTTEISPRKPVGKDILVSDLARSGIIPQFTVFAEQITNIDIKPLAVYDGRKENVQQVLIERDFDNSIGTDYFSSFSIPIFDVTAVITPSLVVNKTINLAMNRPVILPPVSTAVQLGQDTAGVTNEGTPDQTSVEVASLEEVYEYYQP
jgi:hypothetical protein